MNRSETIRVILFENALPKYMRLFLVAGTVVLLDQLTKVIVLNMIPLYNSITVIPGFFDLTHVHNPGGAFGIMAQQSPVIRRFLFLFVSTLAAGLILYFYLTTPLNYRFLSVGFALIFGGAIGNLIDRVRMGKVIDFIDWHIGELHWPAFNIADSAVTIGITIFAVHLIFKKMPE